MLTASPRGEDDDHQLIRRAVAGDSTAFSVLVERYQQRVFKLVSRMIGNREQVEDLVQEVFLKAYRKIDSFRFEASFFTWLYIIAVNTCRNHYRRFEPLTVPVDPDPDDDLPGVVLRSEFERPDDAAHREEMAQAVRAALDTLPPDHREVLVMCDLEGLGYQEIADVLGIPVGTVRSRIFRARAAMKNILEPRIGVH
jgi:RNA polymerase sigma-70 factor (ECF subfamily)